jgi:hypothetical protein
MALVAQVIERAGLDHLGAESSVVIMAVRAFQLPFPDGMMGGFILLHPDGPMADVAEVGLGGLQILPGSRVDGVAVVAGNVGTLVLAQVPEGEIAPFPVAGKALGRLGLGVGDSFAEDEDPNPPFAAFFHVGCPRPMAGFACIIVGRAVGDGFFGVGGHHICFEMILMAGLTDFRSDIATRLPPCLLRRRASAEEE